MTAIIFPGPGGRSVRRRSAEAGGPTFEHCERWLAQRLARIDERSDAPDPVLRLLVADTLADLRALVLGTLASIEIAFEVQAAAGDAASLAS